MYDGKNNQKQGEKTMKKITDLQKLQALRAKSNKTKKSYWTARIDIHFGLK